SACSSKIYRKDQINILLGIVSYKAWSLRIHKINTDFLIINNLQRIDQEFRVKSDHNILAFFFNINIFFHRTNLRINAQLHLSVFDIDDDRFLISLFYQKCCSVNTIQEFFFINLYLCLIIAGKHLINFKIFSLNETGYHGGIIKLKKNMI